MDIIFRLGNTAQGGAADQNRAGGRTPTTGKAARSSPPGPGRAQTHEREQVFRGDIAAHERGRRPHTQTTVHYLQELKRKHGIDYDSHGSYRFLEE